MHLPIAEPPVAFAKREAERQLIGEKGLPGALVDTELLSREASCGKRRADRFRGQPCRQQAIVDPASGRGLHLAGHFANDQDALGKRPPQRGLGDGLGAQVNVLSFSPMWGQTIEELPQGSARILRTHYPHARMSVMEGNDRRHACSVLRGTSSTLAA